MLAGVVIFIAYQYNSQLWIQLVNLYDFLHNRHELKGFISSFGPYSPIAYILLQVIQVIVAPIPGGAIEFLGGYLFGAKAGFLYSMIGLLLGSCLAFSLARIFEKVAVEKFVSEQTRNKFDYLVEGNDTMVEKMDEMAKMVVVKGKKDEKSFMVDDKTKITKGGKEMPFADLKKGMNVSVEYKKDGDKMVAAAIKAAAPKAAKEKHAEAPKK